MIEPLRFDLLRDHYADYFGRAAALYNINPLLGRLYAYLLLSPKPMTLDDLVQTAGAAKSTVSVAVKNLEHFRVVRRHWKKGDRRDYFVARTDVREILRELYQQFFSRELKYMRDANAEARQSINANSEQDDWPNAEQSEELLERLAIMEDFAEMLMAFLESIMAEPNHQPSQKIQIEVEE